MPVTGVDEAGRDMAQRFGNPEILNTPAPASYANTNNAFTAADIVGGIIVQDGTGGSVNVTLPTAAALAAALPGTTRVGDTISCLIINGANTSGNITLTAGTGGSFDTNQAGGSRIVAFGTSKWIQIRFTNVTPGSMAYVIYS